MLVPEHIFTQGAWLVESSVATQVAEMSVAYVYMAGAN